jgi:hypothetical protein
MIVQMRPAPLEALAAMREQGPPKSFGGALGPFAYAASHAALSRSFGYWTPDPKCVACAGLYDHGNGRLEAWFACLPEAASEMVGIVRAARLTLAAVADAETVKIFARVKAGWRPGARIAKALSMRLARVEAGEEIWEF